MKDLRSLKWGPGTLRVSLPFQQREYVDQLSKYDLSGIHHPRRISLLSSLRFNVETRYINFQRTSVRNPIKPFYSFDESDGVKCNGTKSNQVFFGNSNRILLFYRPFSEKPLDGRDRPLILVLIFASLWQLLRDGFPRLDIGSTSTRSAQGLLRNTARSTS